MAGEGVGRWADVSVYEGDTVAIDRWQVRRHSGTSVTETVCRHEIRPTLTTGATAMNKILSKKRPKSAQAVLDKHTLLADRIENPGAGISWPLRAPARGPRQCRKPRSPSGDHPRRVSHLPHNLPTFRPMSQNTRAPQGCLCQAAALCRVIRGL